jgi:AraC-like DNA-binding protein
MIRVLKSVDWFRPDGFPIAVERRDPQEPFGIHTHEFSELVIITSGRGWHVTGNESWPLAAGDVFVISGHRPHDYQSLDNLHLINILFQPRQLKMEMVDLGTLPGFHALFTLEPAWRRRHQFNSRLHVTPQELVVVFGLIDQLDKELQGRAPGFGFLATALFMQLVGYLARCYGRSRNPDSRALLRLAQTISHLEMHLAQPINLDEMASRADMSKRSFIRAFRAATDRTPVAYLIQLRINRAASLLRHSTESITEIAFKVGFEDSNYFTRQFRKIMGVSPRHYRREHGSDD